MHIDCLLHAGQGDDDGDGNGPRAHHAAAGAANDGAGARRHIISADAAIRIVPFLCTFPRLRHVALGSSTGGTVYHAASCLGYQFRAFKKTAAGGHQETVVVQEQEQGAHAAWLPTQPYHQNVFRGLRKAICGAYACGALTAQVRFTGLCDFGWGGGLHGERVEDAGIRGCVDCHELCQTLPPDWLLTGYWTLQNICIPFSWRVHCAVRRGANIHSDEAHEHIADMMVPETTLPFCDQNGDHNQNQNGSYVSPNALSFTDKQCAKLRIFLKLGARASHPKLHGWWQSRRMRATWGSSCEVLVGSVMQWVITKHTVDAIKQLGFPINLADFHVVEFTSRKMVPQRAWRQDPGLQLHTYGCLNATGNNNK